MKSADKPEPLPFVEEDDLLEVAADLGPGVFPSADIYAWHARAIAQAGRKPVSPRAFGLFLRVAGWQSSINYIGGRTTRCWMINKPWARRGVVHVSDPSMTPEDLHRVHPHLFPPVTATESE